MPGWHRGTLGLRMHESEHRQLLGQRTGPGEQCLEHHVGDGGCHALGNQAMQCCAPRLTRKECQDCCRSHPQLSLVGRGRKASEENIVVAARQVRYMPEKVSIEAADPRPASGPRALHVITLTPTTTAAGLAPSRHAGAWRLRPAAGPAQWVP